MTQISAMKTGAGPRILYVGRIFSGLEESLARGIWRPTGVPTIFKMIEALDRSAFDLHLLLACKDGFSSWKETRDKALILEGLNAHVTVLAGTSHLPKRLGRARDVLREVRHTFAIWRTIRKIQPDLVYIDHGNIWSAGILARILQIPVLFRIMGVYPAMRHALTGSRISDAVLRWSYNAPYAFALCTQDGSGPERWLDAALNAATPRHLLINGVDLVDTPSEIDPRLDRLPKDRTIILFLGKLEPGKGCEEFLRGFTMAQKRHRDLHALMIGHGHRREALDTVIAEEKLQDVVTIIDRLPHAQVMAALRRSDIYASLNRFGNLSAANLEAMRAGCCMIIPSSQPASGVDEITDQLLPSDAVVRIPDVDDTDALADAIVNLARDPERRKAMSQRISEVSGKFIPTWSERIERELEIIAALCRGESVQRPISVADA